jgi:hypothetical protein
MYSTISRNLDKIFTEMYKLHNYTKKSIKYGTLVCFAILITGCVLIFLNHSGTRYDPYFEFIANSVVKAGFTNLAIVIIGSMLLDYTFSKK